MCLEIFKDPGLAIKRATKKNMNKTALVMVESAIMAALAVLILTLKAAGLSNTILLGFAANVFALVIVIAIITGYIIKLVTTTLGGKGRFYEGLTAISFALTPVTAGLLIASLLSLIPGGIVIGALVMMVLVALGLAILYRAIKELFKVDMITSFVSVSIVMIALIIGLYASLGLNLLVSAGQFIPGL